MMTVFTVLVFLQRFGMSAVGLDNLRVIAVLSAAVPYKQHM